VAEIVREATNLGIWGASGDLGSLWGPGGGSPGAGSAAQNFRVSGFPKADPREFMTSGKKRPKGDALDMKVGGELRPMMGV